MNTCFWLLFLVKVRDILYLPSSGILRRVYWQFLTDVLGQPIGSILKGQEIQTSRNMPQERRSHPHRNGSPKLRDICFLTEVSVKRIALAFSGIIFDLCDTYCHLLTKYFVGFFV